MVSLCASLKTVTHLWLDESNFHKESKLQQAYHRSCKTINRDFGVGGLRVHLPQILQTGVL